MLPLIEWVSPAANIAPVKENFWRETAKGDWLTGSYDDVVALQRPIRRT